LPPNLFSKLSQTVDTFRPACETPVENRLNAGKKKRNNLPFGLKIWAFSLEWNGHLGKKKQTKQPVEPKDQPRLGKGLGTAGGGHFQVLISSRAGRG
jgi:hypothetical protein